MAMISCTAMAHATPINGLDILGKVTTGDADCWFNLGCSLPRGGDSDVLTVHSPDGSIYAQAFAFGNEEGGNEYFFDPAQVPGGPHPVWDFHNIDGAGWND
jgi:hypothetical protein